MDGKSHLLKSTFDRGLSSRRTTPLSPRLRKRAYRYHRMDSVAGFVAQSQEFEEEYAQEEQGGISTHQWVYEAEDDDYYDYEETESTTVVFPTKVVKEKSDLADHVYWDDSALTACWGAALVDYKVCVTPLISSLETNLTRHISSISIRLNLSLSQTLLAV